MTDNTNSHGLLPSTADQQHRSCLGFRFHFNGNANPEIFIEFKSAQQSTYWTEFMQPRQISRAIAICVNFTVENCHEIWLEKGAQPCEIVYYYVTLVTTIQLL